MKCTSAQAAKILRKLNEQYSALKQKEQKSHIYVAAVGEDLTLARPEYDFSGTQNKFAALEKEIRQIKHSLNVFNTTTSVPGFDMTVDEMLVYIPQLTTRKEELAAMKDRLPKERVMSYNRTSPVIEYTYTNYDVKEAETAYNEVSAELARAQVALDTLNNREILEIADC